MLGIIDDYCKYLYLKINTQKAGDKDCRGDALVPPDGVTNKPTDEMSVA